jgi:hypothetical protein
MLVNGFAVHRSAKYGKELLRLQENLLIYITEKQDDTFNMVSKENCTKIKVNYSILRHPFRPSVRSCVCAEILHDSSA